MRTRMLTGMPLLLFTSAICGCSGQTSEVEVLKAEKTEFLTALAERDAKLSAALDESRRSRATVEGLSEQLEACRAALAMSENELGEAKLKLGVAEQQLSETRTALMRAEAEIKALRFQMAQLKKALESSGNLPFPEVPSPDHGKIPQPREPDYPRPK
ncbi:MAG: hypothetical protein IID34_04045 [Planctomycetes bacterium]|nr:hypothetical protein [Planctomycetota bacterium]